MYCEKCGKEISENATVCPHCANKVIPLFTRTSNKRLLIIVLPIVLFAFTIVIGILVAYLVPEIMTGTNKANMNEAPVMMKQIVTLQKAYSQYHNVYANGDELNWKENIGFDDDAAASRFEYRTTTSPDSIAIAVMKKPIGNVPLGAKIWMDANMKIYTSSPEAMEMIDKTCILVAE